MRIVVIGIGNPFRRDDGAGIEVAHRLRDATGLEIHTQDGEPARLIELWEGADIAYVIDAVASKDGPGSVHRFEVGDAPVPDRPRRDSTHAVRLGDAVELARALGRLPKRLILIGVEGEDFSAGTGLSPAVAAAASLVADQVLAETREAVR